MRINHLNGTHAPTDDWLESQCRLIQDAGRVLAVTVGEVNARIEQDAEGDPGHRITEAQLRQVEEAYKTLHDVQLAVQNALFDCEHELRELREREVSPAELLVDGERLIQQYRFLRRRGRVIDGLLAYLPAVSTHAAACLEHLRQVQEGLALEGNLRVPDCGFALVALEELGEPDERSA